MAPPATSRTHGKTSGNARSHATCRTVAARAPGATPSVAVRVLNTSPSVAYWRGRLTLLQNGRVPPPINVLRVITRLNIGGPAIHAILLTSALDDGAQFRSTLVAGVTAPHEGDMLDLARARSVEPVSLPALGREISPLDDLVALARLVQIVRYVRPDVVHTHMAKAGTVGRLAARVCGVPLIVHTYHGHVFHSYFGPGKTRVFLTIERALGLATHRIVVVGDGQRDEIAGYGVAPRTKIEAIRLGLELSPFLHVEEARG